LYRADPLTLHARYNSAMQKRLLTCHPDSPCDAVERIEAELSLADNALQVRFCVTGDVSRLRLPSRQASTRQDELWRHTCCELFIGAAAVSAYYEINVAPSTEWAAYRFDSYRSGMQLADVSAPKIVGETQSRGFVLSVTVKMNELIALKGQPRFGVASVLEEQGGRLSYWALSHPPGKPDFHRASSFALELAE